MEKGQLRQVSFFCFLFLGLMSALPIKAQKYLGNTVEEIRQWASNENLITERNHINKELKHYLVYVSRDYSCRYFFWFNDKRRCQEFALEQNRNELKSLMEIFQENGYAFSRYRAPDKEDEDVLEIQEYESNFNITAVVKIYSSTFTAHFFYTY